MGGIGAVSEQMDVDGCLFPSGVDVRKLRKSLGESVVGRTEHGEIGVIEDGNGEGQSMRIA
jgi:hypothetical protein